MSVGQNAARDQLAAELDRHHATIMGALGRPTFFDCSCGWTDGEVLRARGRLAGSRERWRVHLADALLAIVGR